MGMRLDKFSGQSRKLVWVNESFESVVRIKNCILKERDTFMSQMLHVALDIKTTHRDVVHTLPVLLKESAYTRVFFPILDQMEPALVWQ